MTAVVVWMAVRDVQGLVPLAGLPVDGKEVVPKVAVVRAVLAE